MDEERQISKTRERGLAFLRMVFWSQDHGGRISVLHGSKERKKLW